MLHVVICDDHPEELEKIRWAAEAYFRNKSEYTVTFYSFANPMSLLDHLEKGGNCDIALLDICMPGVDGLDVARQLQKRYNRVELVFLTTSREFAVDAFALGATHYLIKPFVQTQMDEALERAMRALGPGKRKKMVMQGEGGVLATVEVDNILYVENYRHYRAVYTTMGEMKETRRTMTTFMEELEQLCPGVFIQPYRGYIVNQNAIRAVTKEGILLRSGDRVPIKGGDFRKIRDAYFDWAFRKEGESV